MIIEAAKRISDVEEYYFSRNGKRLDALRKSGVNVINLGVGSPDLPPAKEVIDTLCREAQREDIHGYQPYIGLQELREAYATWYKKWYTVYLNPNTEVLPLIGSKEGVMHIMMAFINEGDGVLLPDPGYPTYGAVAKLVGARVIKYNLYADKKWQPDFEELEAMDLTGVKMMWTNYPNMPTGAHASTKLFEKIVDFGRRHNILIVNDNPYGFILHHYPLSILEIPGAKQVCIELNSLSKSHNMAGWRFGMALSNEEIISTILKVKSNMDSGVFGPMQLAAVRALSLSTDWGANLNVRYRNRQALGMRILISIGCTVDRDQGGLFVWGRVPDKYASAEELSDEVLAKTGIFITPGFIFGEQGVRYLRLSLCAKERTLVDALRLVETYYEKTQQIF